jgi:hypothetical protein
MNKELFDAMLSRASDIITNTCRLRKAQVVLVSGGSAWADYIAVRLWLESVMDCEDADVYAGLKLFLPCTFDSDGNKMNFHGSCGATLNQLHAAFSHKMGNGFDSRADLLCAEALGAELNCRYPGFLNRNKQVAMAEYMIAFTWSDSHERPKEGGTRHTWDSSLCATKIHVPLCTLACTSLASAQIPSDCGHSENRKRKLEHSEHEG